MRLLTSMIILLSLLGFKSAALAQHKGISFQAVLKKPDGTYPNISGLNVTLQILDPVADCVLREEVHSGVNISNGYINLILGSSLATTPAGRNPATVLTIPEVFDNSKSRTGLNCVDHDNNIAATNQTYTPTASHARKLRLRAIVGGDTVVADFNMRAVAYAVNAENLDGKTAAQFVQTSAATTQANVESVFSRYSILDAILNGTYAGNAATATALATAPGACPAGQYMTAMTASGAITCGTPSGSVTSVSSANAYLTVATGTTTPVLTVNVGTAAGTVAAGNDARFTDSRAPTGTAGGDLSGTYPNPTVAKVSGKAVTLTSPAAGDLLTYDGTQFVNSPPPTAVDATKLPLAGGTMSGAIDMASQNLANVGFMTMSANKSLHLSNNSADPSGLVAADKGKIWYNSTSGEIKFWNGSLAQPLGVAGSGLQTFNTQTGTSQTLAIGTTGTAPGWSSASNVHTLNLPMASTASVTAGLISKTDYDSFAAKLDASSALAGDVTGTSGTTSVDKIKGKAVAPAAYAAGQTLRYDGTQWVNAVLGFADLGSKPTTLAGYGITDAQSSTLANGKIFVGNASNVATAVTMSGDATLSNAGALTLATVPVSKGGTGLTTLTGDKLLTTSGAGAVQTTSCGLNQVISFTAGGAITCANVNSLAAGFIQDGNSMGAAATLGTNDAYALNFETNNLPRMTILSDGKVGVGTTTPSAALEVAGQLKITGGTPGAGKYLTSDATGLASWVSPPSTTTLNIVSVVYGNTAGTQTNTCGTYIQSLCHGAGSCTYTGSNTNCGGDPASGQGKIITVTYSCGAGNLTATSNENVANSLSCITNFVTGGNSFGFDATLGTIDNQSLIVKTNNTTRMTMLNTGNIGIGVTNPTSTLDVKGSITSGAALNVVNNDTTTASYAIQGSTASALSGASGVYGVATGAGYVNAVYAYASNTAGYGVGLSARSNSGGGGSAAVIGKQMYTGANSVYGGWFSTVSTGPSAGVYTENTGSSNVGYALSATNNSATGWGVYASGTSPNYFKGNVGIGTTTTGAKLDVNQATVGSIALQGQSAGTAFWQIANPAGGITGGWNTANAVEFIGKDTGTNRSINAAGTINASGADFAEWIDWPGTKPEMGSVVLYRGSYVVVSSPFTAAFIGNDTKDPQHAILVAFAGQLPVLVRGIVHEGDLIVAGDDGIARAVPKKSSTMADAYRAVGTAWGSSSNPGVKRIHVAVGIGLAGGLRDIASLKEQDQQKDLEIQKLKQENLEMKAQAAKETAELKARLEKIESLLKSK